MSVEQNYYVEMNAVTSLPIPEALVVGFKEMKVLEMETHQGLKFSLGIYATEIFRMLIKPNQAKPNQMLSTG